MLDRILLIFTSWPYPTDNGKKVMLKSILEFLIEKYGESNLDLILIDDERIEYNPHRKLKVIQITPSTFSKIKNLINFFSEKSFQEKILYDKKIKKLILYMLNTNIYRFVVFDTLRAGQYIEYIPSIIKKDTKFILYMEDLFHIRYKRILDSIKNYNLDVNELNLFGNFEKFLRGIPLSQWVKNSKKIQLFLLEKEKELINKRELKIIKEFDLNLLVSYEESRYLKKLTYSENIDTLPPFINTIRIKRDNIVKSEENTFLFLGNLAVPHNKISLQFFLENYIENCIKLIPNFKLIIIGKNISSSLKSLIQKYNANIVYKGYVDDISSYVDSSIGMIIPLIFGSGMKLKTLEALSWGLPIISTSFGLEGIMMDESLKKEILEDDLHNFCEKMKRLTNQSYNKYISDLQVKNYKKFYSQAIVKEKYNEIFK